ncbi:Type I restriction-modification system, specificity subunit S [Alteromonas macleodii]|jgi:type I restriction enzyme S subunit|uniref:restriction endonuclease subunit S n=1 Tax=Alteromonas sp. MmMcT2-2 TaxID=2917732 RepID=UPI001EF1658E|nr:restriction endonuclease subunit S [Alteromonas sp. MmMcT2-2]MCG7642161.1 restriction endonuclease subunit S [Alteromonas sp. MmMcT2-2]
MPNWVKQKIGDILTLEYGKPLDKSLRKAGGKYPAYGANGIKCLTDEFLFDDKTIIVGRKGSAGELTLTEERFWPLDVTYFARFDKSKYDLHFIYFLLKTLDLPSLATGVKPGINRNNVYRIEVQIPNLIEQKRIVAILDQAFADIDKARETAEKNLANAQELFDSSLKKIFNKNKGDWESASLSELMERGWIKGHQDGNHGSYYPRKSEFVKSGVPYLSAKCIKNGNVDMNQAKYLTKERAASLRKGIAKDQDVLFAHNATVGPVAILRTEEESVILGTSITYYRCNQKYILPEYLAQYMVSSEFVSQYTSVMRQSTRNQVPITKQREFSFIIPPIEEQILVGQSLAALSNNLKQLQEVYVKKSEKFDELKTSLLQKAFTGELTKSKGAAA